MRKKSIILFPIHIKILTTCFCFEIKIDRCIDVYVYRYRFSYYIETCSAF